MKLSHSAIIRDEQFIAGIGYQDGYFKNEDGVPVELWKLWDHDQRMLYTHSRLYGSHMRFKRDSKTLVSKYMAIWRAMCTT